MRCRCGLIQEPERRGPYLCETCDAEGWTLTPAGYIQVPELARPLAIARPAPAKRRKSGKGSGGRRR
jgi:hypothetical protein